MENKYTIELNKTQLYALARGMEFYSRFLAGQWEIPNAMEYKEYENQDKYEGFWEKRNYVEDQLKILQAHFTGMRVHEHYGIGCDELSEDAKISYDIYRPILEQFANENKPKVNDGDTQTCYSVYDYPGPAYSKEGRIKIKIKE